MTSAEPIRLDVRAVLAAGGEPFELILSAAGRLPIGGALELTTPFEPASLYSPMRRRGFAPKAEVRGHEEWVVTFQDTGIGPTSTVGEIVAQWPATREVFTRFGLDLSRGTGKTLSSAARDHGIAFDLLLEELQAISEE
jgi:hypothetical protein